MSLTISVDTSGLDAVFDAYSDTVESAARPAAQAASQVLYDEVMANVAKKGKKTGNLQKSIYQVYSEDNSDKGRATYHVSWNARVAPHGSLVENGHLQRYRYYQRPDGQIRPMVRAGMEGKPKPGRHASQAEKDAYYVTLPSPVHVAASPFIRPAIAKFDEAMEAAKAELFKQLDAIK